MPSTLRVLTPGKSVGLTGIQVDQRWPKDSQRPSDTSVARHAGVTSPTGHVKGLERGINGFRVYRCSMVFMNNPHPTSPYGGALFYQEST